MAALPIDAAAVAEILNVTPRTVRRYITEAGLPAHRPIAGGRAAPFFFRDEVLAWLRAAPADASGRRAGGAS